MSTPKDHLKLLLLEESPVDAIIVKSIIAVLAAALPLAFFLWMGELWSVGAVVLYVIASLLVKPRSLRYYALQRDIKDGGTVTVKGQVSAVGTMYGLDTITVGHNVLFIDSLTNEECSEGDLICAEVAPRSLTVIHLEELSDYRPSGEELFLFDTEHLNPHPKKLSLFTRFTITFLLALASGFLLQSISLSSTIAVSMIIGGTFLFFWLFNKERKGAAGSLAYSVSHDGIRFHGNENSELVPFNEFKRIKLEISTKSEIEVLHLTFTDGSTTSLGRAKNMEVLVAYIQAGIDPKKVEQTLDVSDPYFVSTFFTIPTFIFLISVMETPLISLMGKATISSIKVLSIPVTGILVLAGYIIKKWAKDKFKAKQKVTRVF
jgi:hypothetical protein